jgi:hypothetical protein
LGDGNLGVDHRLRTGTAESDSNWTWTWGFFFLFWSCGSEEKDNGLSGFALRRLRLARLVEAWKVFSAAESGSGSATVDGCRRVASGRTSRRRGVGIKLYGVHS